MTAAHTDETATTPVLQLDPAFTLIDCVTCKSSISAMAAACPRCGAPNAWRHPAIDAFYADKDTIGTTRPFTFHSDKTSVWGATKPRSPWWVKVAASLVVAALSLWGAIFGFSWLIWLWMVLACVWVQISAKAKTFRADFKVRSWESSDEKFWAPVRNRLAL